MNGERLARSHDSLSVLVPAHNEGRDVFAALSRLVRVLTEIEIPYEVLLVSDGSTDDTVAQASRIPGVTVLDYEERRGKGFALRHAWERSTGRFVAFFDADLDLHPQALKALLKLVRSNGGDAAIGSKVHPDSNVAFPWSRRVQSRVFRYMVRAAFRLDISDTQTGIKVFRREVLEAVMPIMKSEGFILDLELLVFANDLGFRIVEGPVDLEFGFSSTTGLRAVIDMLREMYRVAVRRRELRKSSPFVPSEASETRTARHDP